MAWACQLVDLLLRSARLSATFFTTAMNIVIAVTSNITSIMKHEGPARRLTPEAPSLSCHQSLGAYPRLAATRAAHFADDLGEIIAPMARVS
jgi:hypothetical protein